MPRGTALNMVELLVTNKSIALVFQGKDKYWKIAFGECEKKVFSEKYRQLETVVAEVKRLGFGGYIVLPWDFSKNNGSYISLSILLGKRTKLHPPVMFGHEKNWRSIYETRALRLI
jgi:hypothetical protein